MDLTKRDPATEAKVRMQLIAALTMAQMVAYFTPKTDDDRVIAFLLSRVQDPTAWAALADAIWGPVS